MAGGRVERENRGEEGCSKVHNLKWDKRRGGAQEENKKKL